MIFTLLVVDRSDNINKTAHNMNNNNQSRLDGHANATKTHRGRFPVRTSDNPGSRPRLGGASTCANNLRHNITSALTTEFTGKLDARFVQQVVNEADALASTTPYRGLLFPLLAEEKVRAAAAWASRQQRLLQQSIQFGA